MAKFGDATRVKHAVLSIIDVSGGRWVLRERCVRGNGLIRRWVWVLYLEVIYLSSMVRVQEGYNCCVRGESHMMRELLR